MLPGPANTFHQMVDSLPWKGDVMKDGIINVQNFIFLNTFKTHASRQYTQEWEKQEET